MAKKQVYSVCGMCTVRCPIEVEVEDGKCAFIQGNPHAAGINGALCACGAAGVALVNDDERPPVSHDSGRRPWRREMAPGRLG